MGDSDQVVAYFAYQSLLEQVLHSSAPDQAECKRIWRSALGAALMAQAGPTQGGRGGQPATFGSNPFLSCRREPDRGYRHPPRVRVNLARLLGYSRTRRRIPYLARALGDLDAREMARCSLEGSRRRRPPRPLSGRWIGRRRFCVGVLTACPSGRA